MPTEVTPSEATSSLPESEDAPQTIVLVRDRSRLRLVWQDEEATIAADRLRGSCRCAGCVRARADGIFPAAFEGVLIANVVPVGDYAINVVFADGHNRGIFPWPYLRELALNNGTPNGRSA
jgi:prepilin-type processing-associated H-X9-DG protein